MRVQRAARGAQRHQAQDQHRLAERGEHQELEADAASSVGARTQRGGERRSRFTISSERSITPEVAEVRQPDARTRLIYTRHGLQFGHCRRFHATRRQAGPARRPPARPGRAASPSRSTPSPSASTRRSISTGAWPSSTSRARSPTRACSRAPSIISRRGPRGDRARHGADPRRDPRRALRLVDRARGRPPQHRAPPDRARRRRRQAPAHRALAQRPGRHRHAPVAARRDRRARRRCCRRVREALARPRRRRTPTPSCPASPTCRWPSR